MVAVMRSLRMHDPCVHRTPLDRRNLFLGFRAWVSRQHVVNDMSNQIRDMLAIDPTASAIIFTRLRKETDQLVRLLAEVGVAACAYHGAQAAKRREENFEVLARGRCTSYSGYGGLWYGYR